MRYKLHAVIILLLTAAIITFVLMAVSFDRDRQAKMELANKIAGESIRKMSAPAGFTVVQSDEKADFANREYFSPDALDGGILATAIISDPPGLNPLLANEASASAIFSLCSMTLAERDWAHPERFRPLLAESFSISPDRKSYFIKLRRGVMWHSFIDPDTGKLREQKEVTAHDIKFTIDVIRNPKVNCASIRSYYMDIKDVWVVNDHELIITWAKEYYGSMSSTLSLFPLPRHFYMSDGKFDPEKFNYDHKRNRMIVGCGPYVFSNWETSRSIKLTRNNSYIGFAYRAAPAVRERQFDIIKLPNTQFQSLLAGKLGMLSLSPEQWQKRTHTREFTDGRLRKFKYPGSGYSYIGYNQQIPCFRDAKTRQALTMLINRQEILDKLMYGHGQVAKGPFVPGSIYSDPNILPWEYNPQRAKELLAEAGWKDEDGDGILERDGKKFTFTMLQISGSSMQMRMLPMIKDYFAAAGIDMKLQIVEWSVLLERLKKRQFEACNLGWTGSIDPDPYQIFHSSQASDDGDNFVSLKNAELDKAIEDLRREFDMDKRIALARKIEKIIHEEQPYTFMFYPDALVVVSGDYENVKVFPQGLESLSFYMRKEALK